MAIHLCFVTSCKCCVNPHNYLSWILINHIGSNHLTHYAIFFFQTKTRWILLFNFDASSKYEILVQFIKLHHTSTIFAYIYRKKYTKRSVGNDKIHICPKFLCKSVKKNDMYVKMKNEHFCISHSNILL